MSPASLVSYYVSNNIQRMKRMVCSYLQFCSYSEIQRQISKQKFCREWWICLGRISNSFCRYRSNSTTFPLSLPPPPLSSSSSSPTWEWSVSYECATFLICASHGTHHLLSHSTDLIFSIGLSNTEFMSVSNLNFYPCPRKQLVWWINNNKKKVFQKLPHSKIRLSGTSLVVQRLNPGLPHCRGILYCLSHHGSPSKLEWVAYPFSRDSSWPRDWIGVSCIAGGFFTSWVTREVPVSVECLLCVRHDALYCGHSSEKDRLNLCLCGTFYFAV